MEFEVNTQETGVKDLTREIEDRLDIENGICLVHVPHTTAGITVNENEERLLEDLESLLEELVPGKGYLHDEIDDNAAAHLRSIILGDSVTLPVSNGNLELGTWQSVLLVESDGPRTRKVRLKTLTSG
ncbi:MAG: secondary thiamine-phosphate synthase enzyme YjbQ [Candidatus Nanohaloarchaea archaeon]